MNTVTIDIPKFEEGMSTTNLEHRLALTLHHALVKNGLKRQLISVPADVRGIGKTTALIKFCAMSDLPLIVGSDRQKTYALERAQSMGITIDIYNVKNNNDMNKIPYKSHVVIDELVINHIDADRHHVIIVTGFIN